MVKPERQRYRDTYYDLGPRPVPIFLILLTMLVSAGLVAAHYYRDRLFLQFGIEEALIVIVTYGSVALLTLLWMGWLFFFSRRGFLLSKLLPFLVLAVSIGIPALFRIQFDGSMWPSDLEFRWAKAQFEPLRGVAEEIRLATNQEIPAFNQFLGPNRNGRLENVGLEPPVAANPPVIRWRKDIGAGWSGIIAAGNACFTMEQQNEIELVTCRSLESGELIWWHEETQRHENFLGGVGPRATPLLVDGKLITVGGTGICTCFDAATGDVLWRTDLPDLLGIDMQVATDSKGVETQTENSNLMWGRSGSPLLWKQTVIVPGGGPRGGTQHTFVALDLNSERERGRVVWKNGDQPIGYGSPVVMEIGGMNQLVMVSEAEVSGHDPDSGQLLWKHSRPGNKRCRCKFLAACSSR